MSILIQYHQTKNLFLNITICTTEMENGKK